MNNNFNWNNIGNEIRDAVQQSIQSGDFSELGDVISGSVNDALSEAKRQVKKSLNQNVRQTNFVVHQQTRERYRDGHKMYEVRTRASQFFRRKGDVSSVLFTVFGGIGTGLSAIALLIFSIVAIALLKPVMGIIGSILIALLLGGSIGMLAKGAANRSRLTRAERYLAISGEHGYVNIADLAKHTGKSEAFVRKDVKRMMHVGMFPQGHLDARESCLMLSDETYREYLEVEQRRLSMESSVQNTADATAGDTYLEAEEKRVWRSLSGLEAPGEELEKENPALAQMIREGQECTGHIRQMNDNIRGEVISQKLYQLEHVLKDIFNRVREHPKQMEKMQRFMNYYLPTTIKLVEAYEEFDRVPSPNDEITEAKQELEKTLDTINESFGELLNQMYQESVFDATTDAKVLQTMLAKDGLAKDHAFGTK